MKCRGSSLKTRTSSRVTYDAVSDLFLRGYGAYLRVWEIKDQYQDIEATIPAVVGQPVGAIRNRGTGIPYITAYANNSTRPTLLQTPQGVLYWQFDGIDDTMYGTVQVGGVAGWYLACGFLTDTISAGTVSLISANNATVSLSVAIPLARTAAIARSSAFSNAGTGSSTIVLSPNLLASTPYLYTASATASDLEFRSNRTSDGELFVSSTVTLTTVPTHRNTILQFGRAASSATGFWRGRFYGGALVDVVPTLEEQSAINDFFKRKMKL